VAAMPARLGVAKRTLAPLPVGLGLLDARPLQLGQARPHPHRHGRSGYYAGPQAPHSPRPARRAPRASAAKRAAKRTFGSIRSVRA
jgi:hypothetical protein